LLGALRPIIVCVGDAGATWHVDGGILNGVVFAEVEIKQERQELILPVG
jgi:CYTH domain-containing protein